MDPWLKLRNWLYASNSMCYQVKERTGAPLHLYWRSLPCPLIPHGICPFHIEYVLAEISPILVKSFHLYSMWIPCGFHGFHMDSTWNKSVPHGFHVECGGMVKYCYRGCTPHKNQWLIQKLKTDHIRQIMIATDQKDTHAGSTAVRLYQ